MTLLEKRWFRNLLFFIPSLILITFISFAVLYYSPGSVGRILLEQHLGNQMVSDEMAKEYEERLGVKGSFSELYCAWLKNATHLDFGKSLKYGKPAFPLFWKKFKLTFFISLFAIIFEIIIAFPIGLIAGLKKNSICNKIVDFWSVLSLSIPSFWIALICLYILTIKFHLKNSIGYHGFSSLIIPSLIMGTISCGQLMKIIKTRTNEISDSAFVEFSMCIGLDKKEILFHHVLLHILPISISIIVLNFSSFIGGSIIMESIFNIPGFSSILMDSIRVKDYPLISVSLFFISIIIIALNMFADSLYPLLDARNNSELR